MKVLIGHFTTEANAHIPMKNNLSNYELAFGDEVIERMKVRDVFEQAGIEIIPAVYAGGGPSGVIEKETFLTIENLFLDAVKSIFMKSTVSICGCMEPAMSRSWAAVIFTSFRKSAS